MAKKNNLNKKGGTGELKTYDNSFLANLGRLKGKFREKVPESWRTILPGVSDIEDVAYLLDSYGPNGTILDKAISSAALALPIVGSRALKTLPLEKVPNIFHRGITIPNTSKLAPEQLLDVAEYGKFTGSDGYAPNRFLSSDKFTAEGFATPNPIVKTKGILNTYSTKRSPAVVNTDEVEKFLKKKYGHSNFNDREIGAILRKNDIDAVYEGDGFFKDEEGYQFLNNNFLNLEKAEELVPNKDFSINKKRIRANGGQINNMKKITKAINSQFIPTYIGGYPLFAYGGKKKYAGGGPMDMSFQNSLMLQQNLNNPYTNIPNNYSFGGVVTDGLKAWSNIGLGVLGIDPGYEYENKFFEKAGGVANSVGKVGGQVAANIIAPGVGGAVMGGVQSAGSQVSGQINADKEQGDLLQQQQQQMLKSQTIDNLPAQHDYRPTFAYGGGLKGAPQGKATKEDIKRFEKQYPEEMQMGVQVEYEHTKNKDLAKRIAADHIKDFEKMYGTAGYYQGLKEFGLTDELAMGGVMNSYAGGGSMSPNLDNTTVYANGGSHQNNPMGGVPVGKDALVEENEVRFNDYVFSDRISYKRK